MATVFFLGIALVAALHVAHAGKSVLVLLQNGNDAEKFSSFTGSLESAGFSVTVRGHKDAGLKLKEYGTWLYDDLVLFAPKAEGFGGNVDQQGILDFVDSGHNVLLATNSEASEAMRNLAAEFGVDIDDRGAKVFDHFNYAVKDGQQDHTLIAAGSLVDSPVIAGGPYKEPIIFRGIGATVPADSELATVVLSASPTAYSHVAKSALLEPPALMVGAAISLVSAMQARNNARMVVAGSLDMFTNDFFNAQVTVGGGASTGTANRDFCVTLARWAFQDRGVLAATALRHHLLGQSEQPWGYRVGDDVEFAVDIAEVEAGETKPYKADDIQLEFIMLNPYVRQALTHDGQGTFSLRFKVPDVYGVFKYFIDYSHRGYSYIKLTHQVPVRPFKHNEYERFLACAYPYYASALSVMGAFFALGFYFLYHK